MHKIRSVMWLLFSSWVEMCNTVYTNIRNSIGVTHGIAQGAVSRVPVMVWGIAITMDRRCLVLALAEFGTCVYGENVSHRSFLGADTSPSPLCPKSRELGLLKKYQSTARVTNAKSRGLYTRTTIVVFSYEAVMRQKHFIQHIGLSHHQAVRRLIS